MDPKALIPSPDALPVAWPWFKAVLIPCFTLHLIFMNALLGSGIVGWIGSLRSAGQDAALARSVSQKLPFFMAFAINFGVAALLFMQALYGHLFYASSILMAPSTLHPTTHWPHPTHLSGSISGFTFPVEGSFIALSTLRAHLDMQSSMQPSQTSLLTTARYGLGCTPSHGSVYIRSGLSQLQQSRQQLQATDHASPMWIIIRSS